jgi:hypothetical protein
MDFDSRFEASSYDHDHNEPDWEHFEEWEAWQKMQETATGIADSDETEINFFGEAA